MPHRRPASVSRLPAALLAVGLLAAGCSSGRDDADPPVSVEGSPPHRLVVAPAELELAPPIDPCTGATLPLPGATTTNTAPPTTSIVPGRLMGLDGTTGEELWSREIPFGVGSGHVLGRTLLLLQARQWPDGLWPNIIAVEPNDGSFRWQLFLDTEHPAWEQGGQVVDGPEMIYQLGAGPSAEVPPKDVQDIAVDAQGAVRYVDVHHELGRLQDAIELHGLQEFDIPLDDDHPWVGGAVRSERYTLVNVDGHSSNRAVLYAAGATEPLWWRDGLAAGNLLDDSVLLVESLTDPVAAGRNTGFGIPYGPGRLSLVSAADPDQVMWTLPLRFGEVGDGYIGHVGDAPVFATRDDVGNFDLVVVDDPAALPAVINADSGADYNAVGRPGSEGEFLFDDKLLIAGSSTAPAGTGQGQLGIRRNQAGAPIRILPRGGTPFIHRFGDTVVVLDPGGYSC